MIKRVMEQIRWAVGHTADLHLAEIQERMSYERILPLFIIKRCLIKCKKNFTTRKQEEINMENVN
jgi:hypothetical protein